MVTLNLSALKVFLEVGQDGKVDRQKTLDNVNAQITEYEIRQNSSEELMAKAINTVFERYKGATMATDVLLSFALSETGAHPDRYQELTKVAQSYLKANTGSNQSLFGTSRGKGLWRWKDKS